MITIDAFTQEIYFSTLPVEKMYVDQPDLFGDRGKFKERRIHNALLSIFVQSFKIRILLFDKDELKSTE